MKNILLGFAILFTVSIKAQTSVYHPFPESNAIWIIKESLICNMLPPAFVYYSIAMNGDTVIGNNTYHKVNITGADLSQAQCITGSFFDEGYIRQDSSARMVYIIPYGDSIEQVLYDFNLQVGDTVPGYIERYVSMNPDTVDAIDSVLVGNEYRKRWSICPPYGIYIIEGVGATTGIFEPSPGPFQIDGPGFELNCFSQDGDKLYPDTFGYCPLINAISDISVTTQCRLFPNPMLAETELRLDFYPKQTNLKLSIYSSLGELVRKIQIETTSTIIKRENLTKGIYFYQLTDDVMFREAGKLVVQ